MSSPPHRLPGPFRRDWCSRDLDYWEDCGGGFSRFGRCFNRSVGSTCSTVPSIPTEHVMRKLDHSDVCVF